LEVLDHVSLSIYRLLTVVLASVIIIRNRWMDNTLVRSLVWQIVRCAFCVAVSIAGLDLFRQCFNLGDGRIHKFFVGSMYGVYLLHYPFIVLFTWTFATILENLGHELSWQNAEPMCYMRFVCSKAELTINPYSATELDSEGYLWLGSLVCFVLTNVCVWPLAWSLKQLPGLRDII